MADLQESDRMTPTKENGADDAEQTSLRAGCLKRLKQIHAQLQRQNGHEKNSDETSSQIKMQNEGSEPQLADCTPLLLRHLLELQEVQDLGLLEVLLHRDSKAAQAFREQYEAEIKTKRFTNLHNLLISDDPLTLGSMGAENYKHFGPQTSCTAEVENICAGSVPATMSDSIIRASEECVEVPTTDGSVEQEVCSGCGAVIEELPYLEILCVPDAQVRAHVPEAGVCREEDDSETNSHQSFEKQGSLIPLAWSKQTQDETDCMVVVGDEEAAQGQDTLGSIGILAQSNPLEEKAQEKDGDEASAQHNNPIIDQPDEVEVVAEKDPETMLDVCPHVSNDSFEYSDEGASDLTASGSREITESELWDFSRTKLSNHEEIESREKKEEIRHQAVEREKTMRNLVDMQRKFEQRHQRDKERQMFRVQERLSIIQNRKAEEDLLGLKHTERLKHLTQDLPLEDKIQQKTVVRERLEQLRRERSYIMQSKRDRNTAGFKELLAPVVLHTKETEDGAN
ncbi:PREDICTED: uncharacterized protein LOC107090559 [Cyprinodon variegatus]|uniref:uncharacterized protein LOC107090559 n=1 Tax=Cyprinodon variegatus TaxID=28743 RepID=UPI000742CAB3|nr:PREDICTED: uncharacterized protein LOC107090559 [Cyprinodon variegatus]